MIIGPRISTSPSSASLISAPGDTGPTVPILMRSGGLQVPYPQVSDIPQSSASGTPIAWKNSITSRGVGAAPTFTDSTSSSPSRPRILESTSSSALACSAFSSSESSSPACSALTLRRPTSSAHCGRLLALLVLLRGHSRPRSRP